jgi:hypothetical protein
VKKVNPPGTIGAGKHPMISAVIRVRNRGNTAQVAKGKKGTIL